MSRRGFTLIEVVLAIGLTAMVVYLLSTATELYLANVDASRTRVETAQLARTLLDQIAGDLANVRVSPPAANRPVGGGFGGASGSPPGGGDPGGGAPSGGNGGSGDPSSSGSMGGGSAPGGAMDPGAPGGTGMGTGGAAMPGGTSMPPAVGKEGVYGSVDQLRIDRQPYANWERATRAVELQEASSRADAPLSVRYFFVDDDVLNAQGLAQKGVAREVSPMGVGGLYRETVTTASLAPDDPPLPTSETVRTGAHVELLAPEVVGFELTYFDGTDFFDEWDPIAKRGQPRGVDILLTIAEPRFQPRPNQEEQQRLAEGRYTDTERVEYRRFVRLPLVAPLAGAQPLIPQSGQGGGPGGGAGQPGGGQPGQPGGNQGSGQPGGDPSQGGS